MNKVIQNEIPREEPSDRTTNGIRQVLFDVIDDLRSDKITVNRADKIVKACACVIASAKLDVDHLRFLQAAGKAQDGLLKIPSIDFEP